MTVPNPQVFLARESTPPGRPAPTRDRTRRRLPTTTASSSRPALRGRVIELHPRPAPPKSPPAPEPNPDPPMVVDVPDAPRRRSGKRLKLITVPVAGMERTRDGRRLVVEG